tara:strand:+ start:5845 stop:6609 length:765 start_codon:yes stop_codon:yes gene_type:complete
VSEQQSRQHNDENNKAVEHIFIFEAHLLILKDNCFYKMETQENDEEKGEWNSKLEDAARDIGQQARSYKNMHILQAQKASRHHKYLVWSGIIIGPLSSVLSSIGLALEMENNPVISIIVIILGFLSGTIVTAVKFGKYDEVCNANKSAAARYTSIEANIRRQLGMSKKDRQQAASYMDWLETKYQEILLAAPLVSAKIYTQCSIDQVNPIIHTPSDDGQEEKNIQSHVMTNLSEINYASDKMLAYELKRLSQIS